MNNKEMAYITWVYMSDWSLSIMNRGYAFRLSSIDMDYLLYTQECFEKLIWKEWHISIQTKIPKWSINPTTWKFIQQKHFCHSFRIFSKDIFLKLKEETNGKKSIPQWIKNSDLETKIEFLSWMIDWDWWIVYNISWTWRWLNWQIWLSWNEEALKDVSKFCNVIWIKNYWLSKVKDSKSTYRMFFDILDMLKYKFNFKIKRKNERLEFIRKILNDYMLISKTKPKRIKEALWILDEDIVWTSTEK